MDWSERTRSAFILKAEIGTNKAIRFSKILCRQDDRYIPRITEHSQDYDSLDKYVLRYEGNPGSYGTHRRRGLNRSRLQAILHLCAHFHKVDLKTWEALIGKRLKRFNPR